MLLFLRNRIKSIFHFLKHGTKLQQDLVDDHGGPGQPIQNYFAKQSANIE